MKRKFTLVTTTTAVLLASILVMGVVVSAATIPNVSAQEEEQLKQEDRNYCLVNELQSPFCIFTPPMTKEQCNDLQSTGFLGDNTKCVPLDKIEKKEDKT